MSTGFLERHTMAKARKFKPDPGDVEVRIRPDGKVYVIAADEETLDLAEGIDPDNPVVAKRRKAKKRGKAPTPSKDAE